MRKILFATDFSKVADNAFVYALKLAKKINAEITTVHVYKLPEIRNRRVPYTMQEIYDSIELEEFENYKDYVPKLREIAERNDLCSVEVRHAMVRGDVMNRVVHLAREENADLIIMGTRGASGLKEIFMGSNTASVIDKAHGLVLSIPEEARFDGSLNRMAFTTDFKEDELKALEFVVPFAELFGAELQVIHFDALGEVPRTDEASQWMDAAAGLYDRLSFERKFSDDIGASLSEYCKDNQVDILIMLSHKRNALKKFFQYSLSRHMANHMDIPLLTVPNTLLEQQNDGANPSDKRIYDPTR